MTPIFIVETVKGFVNNLFPLSLPVSCPLLIRVGKMFPKTEMHYFDMQFYQLMQKVKLRAKREYLASPQHVRTDINPSVVYKTQRRD